ncbi:peptide/nickel transport system permease protein [Sulfitobacter pontiacus]|jgi:peptide/nickel transport system permease protein|uniref:Peptide/nickel transport system permease protein n=1 Tax=Sulfitobacter pontiacus TaxID=60137 RepID=A0A1H2TTH4_9RHOB|nr:MULTISPECIES: ABC transporter permease [Sulfitobacter]QPO07651.1 ABC transporter permease [Sulfitobacter sp. B30-2]SDW47180.1 peptide/nickel transport system permease protein [Sulfitobacter pontiacus]
MDPLTWTGALDWVNPLLGGAVLVVLLGIAMQMVWPLLPTSPAGTRRLGQLTSAGIAAATALLMVYVVGGIFLGAEAGIFGGMSQRLLPVWAALIVTFALSITFKRRLGLYGKLFDSTVGMIGFGLVMFWVYTGLFGGVFDMIVTHDSLSQTSGMKNKLPGTPLARAEDGDYPWFLLGGDNLARDVFSRLIKGAWVVIQIAPMATVFAFMVGITLGLPAGYYGGKLDVFLSFLANLILAFPVILIFYLLVTPEIVLTGLPNYMAIVLFIFPLVFLWVLLNTRLRTQPGTRTPVLVVVLGLVGWLYLAMISDDGALVRTQTYEIPGLPAFLDFLDIGPGLLVVFVAVVFVNAPTVFRIVRGLALDIKTRDYVAAAQTRGEGPWYIMLWEILPNARGPLIVDFCLRIGYTTILLGTLGFFGLGLESESPDWGTTINAGRRLLALYPHAAIAPALALLSLVLGLNLLADGLREESLRD